MIHRRKKILIVGTGSENLRSLFPASKYDSVTIKSAAQARNRLSDEHFDLIVVSGTLPDESPVRFASECAGVHQAFVILIVPGDIYDQACYQCADLMVFVLSSPIQKNLASQAVSLIEKCEERTRVLERQIQKEKQKLNDEKMIAMCKLKLVENYHWTEEKAHSFIGKKAMDHSTTRVNVARILLNRLQAGA